MILPPKICPECGEEYVHSVATCAHCEVPLVLADATGAGEPSSDLPPVEELTSVRVASAGWSLALSELLVEQGIPHRVAPVSQDPGETGQGGAAGPFGVYVRTEDVEAARTLDASLMQREIPDLPDDWEAAGEGGEGCPACGAAVPDGAAECPDCGLALG